MPMKNPPHPGLLVADELEELQFSVANAAKKLGVSRQHLNNVVTGRSGIGAELALRLERAGSGKAEHWLAMQAAYELAKIRSAGALPDVEPLARATAAE